MRRCLEDVSKFMRIKFFPQFKLGCGPQGFNSSEINLFICRFEQVGINAENFEKREFVLIVTYLLLAGHQYLLNHPIFTPQTLVIEGGNYHDKCGIKGN